FGRQPLPRPPLRAFTSRTITDPARLAQEVAEVKARGWAQATGEREDDLNAVAAPVRGPSGELIAILGVQGPASRFHRDSMQAAVAILLDRARALSAALGSPA
ncbi:MAG: IclR family transcriptional regulator, partial [Thermoleophilia bacterium]